MFGFETPLINKRAKQVSRLRWKTLGARIQALGRDVKSLLLARR